MAVTLREVCSFSFIRRLSSSKQILLCLVLGIICGSIFKENVAFMKIFGDIFLKMIKMTVVPLIFVSVTQVFCSISDVARMGRIAVKCIAIYIFTTLLTAAFGIFISAVVKAGVGVHIDPASFGATGGAKIVNITFAQMIVNMFPDNPFKAFVEGDVLQILIFASVFGITINKLSNDVHNVVRLIDSLSKIVFKLVDLVIKFTPIGIFGIMTYLSGTQDSTTLTALLKLAGMVYASGFVVAYVFYGIILMCFGLNPICFFKKIFQVQYFTFLTSSSAASVPLTKIVSERKLGVNPNTASLTVPLGAAFNMNGTSLHLGVTSVFLAQIYGLDLNLAQYCQIIFLSIMLTIGGAGIPAASLLMMPMILSSIGVPAEYVAVYIGIDRFLDMMRSGVNVTGDILAGVLVDKSEGTLDMEMYKKDINFDITKTNEVQKAVSEASDDVFN